MNHNIEIILYRPQIPQNTGNIVRTCSVTGSSLTLITPLGFKTSDRWLKRAGLDYWNEVKISEQEDLEKYLLESARFFYFFSSKAKRSLYDASFSPDVQLVFGSETEGLPEKLLKKWPDRCVRIPMLPSSRCLNLATSVGIGLYEALRQTSIYELSREDLTSSSS